MGVELMVSIWPTVDRKRENYGELLGKGHLIRTERDYRLGPDFMGSTIHFDAANPGARGHVKVLPGECQRYLIKRTAS